MTRQKGIFICFLFLLPVIVFGEFEAKKPLNVPKQQDNNKHESFKKGNDGFQAYDCGKPSQIATISLIDVGDCNITRENTTTTKTQIHLLQRLDYQSVKIIQCKIKVHRRVVYCGKSWYTFDVNYGDVTFIEEINKDDCKKMQEGKQLELRKNVFVVGKPNRTITNQVTFAGKYDEKDWCEGDKYSDAYGSWEKNVVVQGEVTVTLKSMWVNVQLSSQKIILPSGQQCDYKKAECTDSFNGQTFWDTLPSNENKCDEFGILYDQTVDKIVGEKKTIFKLETEKTTFALATTKQNYMCGTIIYETEHPRLLIWEKEQNYVGNGIGKKLNMVENMDMAAYVNTKFLYYDFNMKREMASLYYDILQKECELEKKVLENTLTLATRSPDEFALRFKKSQGYTGIVSGEVIHLAKCTPVEVSIRKTTKCYTELPVKFQEFNLFLSPVTHILKSFGTEVPCSDNVATMFKLNDVWFKFDPAPSQMWGGGPHILQPQAKIDWAYTSPQNLADGGIYSSEDLEKMRIRIMNGQESPAIINEIIKGATGNGYMDSRISLWNLLQEEYNLANPFAWFWNKVTNFFSTVGTVCATLYGLFIICHIIKAVIQLIINAFALNTIGGAVGHIMGTVGKCCYFLVSSLFSGPTMFAKQEQTIQEKKMVKAAHKLKTKYKNRKDEEEEEEEEVEEDDIEASYSKENDRVILHKKPIKHHQLKSEGHENIEIYKMKSIP